LLLLFGSAWYLAYAGALRRHQERQIADSEARLRTLSTQLITAQEDERRKLSRDLHDELGQLVTAVTIDLQRASQAGNHQKQEALTNVAKHARAQEVFVELRAAGKQVFLAVRDQGVGFAPEAIAGRGLGLLGMRERAELLNGTFVVKAAPEKGTEIQVTIPIP